MAKVLSLNCTYWLNTANIKVSYVGYNALQVNGVSFSQGKITFQDLNLKKKVVETKEVEVTSYKIPLVDKYNTSQTTITREDIPGAARSRDVRSVAASTAGVFQRDENEIIVRGSRSDETQYYVDGVKTLGVETTNYISNSLRSAISNLEYTIDIPYNIPSDGEDYGIKIKEASIPVNYVYHTVPKLENDVFLTAEILNWTQLNLLSGKSSIYFQGTFTGQSYIDVNQANDTLSVSLGRDKDIYVNREGNKAMIDKRIIGNTVKETIGWDITIKNNKDLNIKVIIEDQYPISEKKSIEVELLESVNGKLDEKTGRLTWELQLEPNEKKIITYKYSVKYPKALNLTLE